VARYSENLDVQLIATLSTNESNYTNFISRLLYKFQKTVLMSRKIDLICPIPTPNFSVLSVS